MANKVTIEIDGKNANAIASINGVEKKLLDLDRVGAGVTRSMGSLGGVFSGLINPSFMIGAGITTIVTGFTALIGKSISLANELHAMSQRTGVSVEALSQLEYAAKLSETSLESLQGGLKKMSSVVFDAQQGGKEATKIFDLLHISLSDDKGYKNNLQIFMEFADKFSKMADGGTKSALTTKVFGRALGQELIPMLNEGSTGLEKMMHDADAMGKTISTQTAKDADALVDETEKLKFSLEGLAIQTLPSVISAVNSLSNLIKGGGGFIQDLRTFRGEVDNFFGVNVYEKFRRNAALVQELYNKQRIVASEFTKGFYPMTFVPQTAPLNPDDIKPVTSEVNKLLNSWDDVSLKLKNDITLAGLTPMNQLIFKHVEEAEKLLQKYQGIAGATGLIREHLLVGLTSEILKEPKPMQQTEIGTPGDLVPGFNMEQMQFLHDQQIALAADVTDQELAMYALREGAYTDMLGNMAGAMQNFANTGGKNAATLFRLYKVFATANAIISGKEAVMHAYKEGTKWGGPILGGIFAAAAGAFALSQIASINSSTMGGGGGGAPPSAPSSSSNNNTHNVTNNTGGSKEITINIYGFVDKDLIARELIPSLEKAWADGVGHG